MVITVSYLYSEPVSLTGGCLLAADTAVRGAYYSGFMMAVVIDIDYGCGLFGM